MRLLFALKQSLMPLAAKFVVAQLLLCALLGASYATAKPYIDSQAFIDKALGGKAEAKVLWVSKDLRSRLKQHLSQSIPGARVRYWQAEDKTVWILNKIGRDKPITMAFVMVRNKIDSMAIIEFRESRGYEVRYPQFTNQFRELELNEAFYLSAHVDNITGATLSVNAVKKAAKLALFLQGAIE